jgi:hypothetical protein
MIETIWIERARLALQAAVPALERTLAADKARDKDTTAISAVETTLWIRALGECYDEFAPPELSVPQSFRAASSDASDHKRYRLTRGLRLVGNKGVHEMIFPTSENMRYDFFQTGIISATHTYCWSPLEAWKDKIRVQRGNNLHEDYNETVAGRSVVPTLAAAISSFHDRALRMDLQLSEAFADFDRSIMRYL